MSTENLSMPDLRLLANFVHQIINPLNGVIGTIDNIIDGSVPTDKKEQRLIAARAQLEFSVMIVRNLAYFTEQSLVPGSLSPKDLSKPCEIPKLVIEAAQFFQESGLSKGISIHLVDRLTQYTIDGPPELLRQVFMNIFDNAVKYSDRDTDVRVTTRIQKKANCLLIEVANTGPGFSFEESKTIFNAGVRGKEAIKLIASGSGLGLYICKLIVEDHLKGSMTAEYSPATRTVTIRLRFPHWRIT